MKIPNKKDWEKASPVRTGSNWYTDGFKTVYSIGARIYRRKHRKALSISFSKDTTTFQAEATGIHHALEKDGPS